MAEGLSTEVKTDTPKTRFLLIAALLLLVFLLLEVFLLKPKLPFKTDRQVDTQPQLVVNFPQIPVYQNAILLNSSTEGTDNYIKYVASWQTPTDVPAVSKWYLEALKTSGWTIDIPPGDTTNNEIQLIVAKKEGLTLNLSLIRNSNSSVTQITAEFPPKAALVEEDKSLEENE